MSWVYTILCISFLSAVLCDPVIRISKGALRGRTSKSRSGRDFYSFTSIPYAKPPIDELRFKPPKPVDPWDGILDATKETDICIQNNHFIFVLKGVVEGVEDCLYLNVHTPNLNGKLPVMFWIHGGGFHAGHSRSEMYGPDYFMDKDVVFVSFNYRLGVFGFISTEDNVIPGNYGMKDQVLALRWVQENIANFGGDPGQVTVFGESAGGASTGYHLLSPMSKGLFHKAILQSGTPLCNWAVAPPGLIRRRTEAIATLSGCHADTSEDILNCLRKIPATSLVKNQCKFFDWINHPSIIFSPVIESCDSKEEAFICNNPITNFKQESIVPTMIGFNSGEGGIFVSGLFNETSLRYPEIHEDAGHLLAYLVMYQHLALPEYLDDIKNRVLKEYFPSGKMEDNSHSSAVEMIGEGIFVVASMSMGAKLASPVYVYMFDYEQEFSFNKLYGECQKSLGVSHGDEMISLFPMKVLIPKGLNEKDSKVSKLMVDIWVKFASSKTPTVDGTDNGSAWPVFTTVEDSSLLYIDSAQPTIIKNPYKEKYKFWSELPLSSRLVKSTSRKTSYIKSEF